MTATRDPMRRLAASIVENQQRAVNDTLVAQRYTDIAIDFIVEYLFSKAAIGRAAENLSGNRPLALAVIASVFGVERTEDERVCEQCNSSGVVTITAYGAHPSRLICPECGVIAVKVGKGA